MTQNIEQEIVSLKAMTATELRVRYAEVFGEPARIGHKVWLIKRIVCGVAVAMEAVRILKPGFEDTGASPGELKQSITYSAYTPPTPKKKKKDLKGGLDWNW